MHLQINIHEQNLPHLSSILLIVHIPLFFLSTNSFLWFAIDGWWICLLFNLQVLDSRGHLLVALGYGLWPSMVLISEIVQTFILADFCYYYVKRLAFLLYLENPTTSNFTLILNFLSWNFAAFWGDSSSSDSHLEWCDI